MKSKQDKEKNFVSAVIYIHNDEERIETFLHMLCQILEDNFLKAEIICVNDASKDKSVEIIRSVSSKVKNISITIINMNEYHGVELAMNAGVDLAIGDFVFEFDEALADFASDCVMDVYRCSLGGVRYCDGQPGWPSGKILAAVL